MHFDMGLTGLGILLACSLGFGVVAQLIAGGGTRWMWLLGAVGWFVGGFFASEVVWGTATEEELQPLIDGLLFDESLLGGLIGGLATAIVVWLATRGSRSRGAWYV